MEAQAQRVHFDPELRGQGAPRLDLLPTVRFVVAEDEVPALRGERLQAALEAIERCVVRIPGPRRGGRLNGRRELQHDRARALPVPRFVQDVPGHSEEVPSGVGGADALALEEAPADAIDRLVRQLIGMGRATAGEEPQQAAADRFVSLSRPLPLGIERRQQHVEAVPVEARAARSARVTAHGWVP